MSSKIYTKNENLGSVCDGLHKKPFVYSQPSCECFVL